MSAQTEPRNPLYLLLLLVSLLFVLTALAYAFVPALEDKAAQAGAEVPASPFRNALRRDGWKWLLYELGGMLLLGLSSMWLDQKRLRRLQNQGREGTMPAQGSVYSSSSGVDHGKGSSTDRGTAQTDQLS